MSSAADWLLSSSKGNSVPGQKQTNSGAMSHRQQEDALQDFIRQNSTDNRQPQRPKYHKQGSSTSNKQSDTPKYTGPSQPIPSLPNYSGRLGLNSGLPLPADKELIRKNSYDLQRSDLLGGPRSNSMAPQHFQPSKTGYTEEAPRSMLRSSANPYSGGAKGAELQKSSTLKTAKVGVSEIPSPTSQKTTRKNLKPVNFFDNNRLMDPTSYHNSELELTLTEYAKFNSGLKKSAFPKSQKLEPIEIKNPVVDDDFEAVLDDSIQFDRTKRGNQANKGFERGKAVSSDIKHRRLQPAEQSTRQDREAKRSQARSLRRNYDQSDEVLRQLDTSLTDRPTRNTGQLAPLLPPVVESQSQRGHGAYQRGLLSAAGGSKPPSELSFQGFFGTGVSGSPVKSTIQQTHAGTSTSGAIQSSSQPLASISPPKITKTMVSTQTETKPPSLAVKAAAASQTDETHHHLRDAGQGMKERYQQRLRLKQIEEEAIRKKNTPPAERLVILPELWERFAVSKSQFNYILVKTLLDNEKLEIRGVDERVKPAPSYIGVLRDMFDEESLAELFPADQQHPKDIFIKEQFEPAFARREYCAFRFVCPPKKISFGVQAGRVLPKETLVQNTETIVRSNLAALLPKNQASSGVIMKAVQLVPPVVPYMVRLAPQPVLAEEDDLPFFDEEDSFRELDQEDLEELELGNYVPRLLLADDEPHNWRQVPVEQRDYRTCSRPKPKRISLFVDEVKPLKLSLIDRFVKKDPVTPQMSVPKLTSKIEPSIQDNKSSRYSKNFQTEEVEEPYRFKSVLDKYRSPSQTYSKEPVRAAESTLRRPTMTEDSKVLANDEWNSWTEPDSHVANASITAVLGKTYRKIPSNRAVNESYWFEVVDQGELHESRSLSRDQSAKSIKERVVIRPEAIQLKVEQMVYNKPVARAAPKPGPLTLKDFMPTPAAELKQDRSEEETLGKVYIPRTPVGRPHLNGSDTLWKCSVSKHIPLAEFIPQMRQAVCALDIEVPGVESIQKMLPIGVAPSSRKLSFKGSPKNSSIEISRPLPSEKVVNLDDIPTADNNSGRLVRRSPKSATQSRSPAPAETRPPAQPLVKWTPDWVSSLRKPDAAVAREQVQMSTDTYMKNKSNFARRVIYPSKQS